MKKIIYLISVVSIFLSCSGGGAQITDKTINDDTFDKAYFKFYGNYYSDRGVEQNVIDLDLYSQGLDLDESGHIAGSGTNLYLSDIFISPMETGLQEGTYLSSDTLYEAFTFLPGVNYDGNISGAYILNITDGNLVSYIIFDEGSFVVNREESGNLNIDFEFKYTENGRRKVYKAQYNGQPIELEK